MTGDQDPEPGIRESDRSSLRPAALGGLDGTVGLVGLGLMGTAMAGRFLDLRLPLVVYNRTRSKAEPLEEHGASLARDAREAAVRSTFLCVMVADGFAVKALLEQGLAEGLGPGKVLLNFSTVGPQMALALARAVERLGAAYLDVPVLGSIDRAAAGRLLLFAAGDATVIERVRPILEALSQRIFLMGSVGQASAVKLIANMLLARYTEALGEVLALARGFRLEPTEVLEILQSSDLASPMWKKGDVLLRGSPPLHFPLRHMSKDLRLLDEEVERLGLALPVQESVLESFQEAEQSGLGDRDYSEIVRLFERGR